MFDKNLENLTFVHFLLKGGFNKFACLEVVFVYALTQVPGNRGFVSFAIRFKFYYSCKIGKIVCMYNANRGFRI